MDGQQSSDDSWSTRIGGVLNGHKVDVKGKGRAVNQDESDGDGDREDDGAASLHELEESAGFLRENDEDDASTRPKRTRSSSLSSLAYAFNVSAIPLSRETIDPKETSREVKHLDLLGGISLIVGLQVGSGIFSSPGILTADCGSVGAALCVWLGAGLLAWTGASSFAELGAAIPLNGGAQAYLRYAYGPSISYLFSWTAIVALKPASAAIISIIFGEYLCRILYHTALSASSEESAKAIPLIVVKLVAVLAVSSIALLNAVSLKLGTRTSIALTLLKLLALLAVAIMGLVQLGLGRASNSLRGNIFEGSSTSPGRYALALYSGLWAYDGWDQCCYVAGEMKDVARHLPRAIHISLPLVIGLFLMANISYFIVLPTNLVSHSNTVGLDFGKEMFGAAGGVLFAIIVAVSCFGAVNSSFFTSSRIIFVAAKEGYLPKMFAKLHLTRKTPINSIILQAALTYVMIAIGDFSSLVAFTGFIAWLFYLLTVLGLLILRNREPNLPRPYRTYLITPITFCCVALFLLFMPIFSAPLEALAAIIFVTSGLPVYYITQTKTRHQRYMASGFVGQQEMPPPTWRERIVDEIRDAPEKVMKLFGRGKAGQGDAGEYEAVELEEEDQGGLSRSTTRPSVEMHSLK